MASDYLITIPAAFKKLAGTQVRGMRVFERKGTHQEMAEWFDEMWKHIGPCLTIGDAANYTAVTRAGVYKRLTTGRLTAFSFEVITRTNTPFGGTKKLRKTRVAYVPAKECQEWRKDIEARATGVSDEKAKRIKSRRSGV